MWTKRLQEFLNEYFKRDPGHKMVPLSSPQGSQSCCHRPNAGISQKLRCVPALVRGGVDTSKRTCVQQRAEGGSEAEMEAQVKGKVSVSDQCWG